MHYKDAETRLCYRAETSCNSFGCMAWRWLPLMADKQFTEAVALAEQQGKGKTHAQAAKYVTENRAEYGLPTEPFEGYCGPCGKPQI